MDILAPYRARRCISRLCRAIAAISLTLGCGMLWGQTLINSNNNGINATGNVIGNSVLYSIGGGRAVSMTQTGNMQSLGVGIGWNSNLICGNMSLTTTLKNQLNGLTTGFKSIMSTVIQSATQAVASLPALIIQRADPALYNLLTNGVLQARLDFDRSKLTCRAIGKDMADIAGGQFRWDQLAEAMTLKTAVSSGDAVSAITQAESTHGNNGVPWVGGSNAGGTGQNSIKMVSDVTQAGYNLLNGRNVTDTTAIDNAACANSLTCQTWSSPQAAVAWATRVLGEREVRTCDSCTKTQATAGVGLSPLIQQEYTTKLQAVQNLVTGNTPITTANLEAAGSDALPLTRAVIEALRDEPDQDVLGKRLASEVALSSVLEKALLLQRTLLTGKGEPNVAANQLAQQAVDSESNTLEQEISNLKNEMELGRELAGNSPMAIIQREGARSAGSRGIYQGDPTRDRLDQIQKPQNNGNN